MDYFKRLQTALSELAHGNKPPGRSQLMLLQEFFRRELMWGRALGLEPKRSAYQLYDLAVAVSSGASFSPSVLLGNQEQLTLTMLERECVNNASRWYSLHEERRQRDDLPDPFEPLVIFFERGGRFSTEHGIFDVNRVGGFQYSVFIDRLEKKGIDEPVILLDAESLDRLDQQWTPRPRNG